jgi:hypothetical protein
MRKEGEGKVVRIATQPVFYQPLVTGLERGGGGGRTRSRRYMDTIGAYFTDECRSDELRLGCHKVARNPVSGFTLSHFDAFLMLL